MDYNTLFHWAIRNNNTEISIHILNLIGNDKDLIRDVLLIQDRLRYAPFHWAMLKNNTEILSHILNLIGNDKDLLRDVLLIKDSAGDTPLHWPLRDNNTEILIHILNLIGNDKDLIRDVLLNQDSVGDTPFHWAMRNNNTEILSHITFMLLSNELYKEWIKIIKNCLEKLPEKTNQLLTILFQNPEFRELVRKNKKNIRKIQAFIAATVEAGYRFPPDLLQLINFSLSDISEQEFTNKLLIDLNDSPAFAQGRNDRCDIPNWYTNKDYAKVQCDRLSSNDYKCEWDDDSNKCIYKP